MTEVLRGFRDAPIPCEAVVAEFVFGPMVCGVAAVSRTPCQDRHCRISGRHDHAVCPDHGGAR